MNEAQKKLHDMFEAYKHTSDYRDTSMMEIMLRKAEFEQTLDKMWQNFKNGNVNQIFTYHEQVKTLKIAGLQVLRSKSTGKHKIVFPKK